MLRSFAMPVMTLCCVMVAQMMRMTRAAVIDQLQAPYIEMVLLKGATPMRMVLAHALPNAVGPIANAVALSLSYLLGGVIIVETIFNYPGVASLMVDGVTPARHAAGADLRDAVLRRLPRARHAGRHHQHRRQPAAALPIRAAMTDSTIALAVKPRRPRPAFNAVGLVSLAVLLFWLLAAVIGPSLIADTGSSMGEAAVFAPISAAHWFGTDFLGRDMLARVVQGARYTVGVALRRRCSRAASAPCWRCSPRPAGAGSTRC